MNLLDEHNTIFSVYLVFNFFLSRSFYLCVLLMIFNFKIIIKMLLIFHKWVSTKMLRFSATKSFARALVFANNTNNRIEFVFIQNEIIIIIYYMCMKSRLLYSCFFLFISTLLSLSNSFAWISWQQLQVMRRDSQIMLKMRSKQSKLHFFPQAWNRTYFDRIKCKP